MVGADSWGVEVVPNPDANKAFPVHQDLITKNGIFIHENLDLAGLAAEKVYQFVYLMLPLRIKGAHRLARPPDRVDFELSPASVAKGRGGTTAPARLAPHQPSPRKNGERECRD